jgi:hypothetical protein
MQLLFRDNLSRSIGYRQLFLFIKTTQNHLKRNLYLIKPLAQGFCFFFFFNFLSRKNNKKCALESLIDKRVNSSLIFHIG